ncbi:MAG: chromosome partitioning protein [Actinomycetota bacterium]|jgi:chromosome partitioning protein|nr:chromosome partitioning protein [Actinomycetota bacterium]
MSDDDLAARGRAIFDRLREDDQPVEELASASSEPSIDAPGVEEVLPEDVAAGVLVEDAGGDGGGDGVGGLPTAETPDEVVSELGRVDEDEGVDRPSDDQPADPAESAADVTTEHEAPTAKVDTGGAGLGPNPLPGGDAPELQSPRAADIGADLDRESGVVADHPGFRRPLPRIMAIANQKGGVGKTTTAVNLGAALAELGYRVLVADLDPQGNATTGLGVNPRNLETSIYDVIMHDAPLEDCIEPTSLRNLFVAPATIDLAGAEIELVPAFSRELKLRRALEALGDDFDFTLIDCPPSLGLITVNGLAAATEVVVPIQCEYYALEGLGQLLRNVSLVQANLNPKLEVSAIILTMYDARTKLADQVASEVRLHFGPKVCRNIVPRTVRLSEAPSFGQPIIVFDPSSRGAIAYRELAKEVSGGAPQRVG